MFVFLVRVHGTLQSQHIQRTKQGGIEYLIKILVDFLKIKWNIQLCEMKDKAFFFSMSVKEFLHLIPIPLPKLHQIFT